MTCIKGRVIVQLKYSYVYQFVITTMLAFSGGIRVNFTGTGMNVSQSPQLYFRDQGLSFGSQKVTFSSSNYYRQKLN